MNIQPHTAEATAPLKTKRAPRGIQPKTHAAKSRVAAQVRRKIIANALLDGKTTMEAGLLAGLSPKTADSQVSQILNHPKTKDTLLAAMTARGMDNAYLAEHHRMLIEGKKFIPARGSDSETNSYIEVPDNQARAKGLELAYRLMGGFTEKHELDIKRPVNIVIRKFCSPEDGRA